MSERGIISDGHQAPDTYVGDEGVPAEGDTGPEIAQGTRIVIVRHGEAVCNAEEYIGGHNSCRGLTARGVRQVEVLAARLARTGELATATAFYTSILPRAIETGAIISSALGGASFVSTCSLCERHSGEADGLTWAEYGERYLRRSLPGDEPDRPLSPGGETWVDFVNRGADALTGLALAHPRELIVVAAHGGIIDASMIRFLKLPGHGAETRLHPEHSSLTEWQYTGSKWRLVRYSDAAHLLDAGTQSDGRRLADELYTAPPPWVVADPHPRPERARSGRTASLG
jgi:probable phosphoglycerate mutase